MLQDEAGSGRISTPRYCRREKGAGLSFLSITQAYLSKVIDRLCHTTCSLSTGVISSITGRERIIERFIKSAIK